LGILPTALAFRLPELPDIAVYLESLERRVLGARLLRIRLLNPFLLRTAVPPIASAEGSKVLGLRRLGKRIVLALEGGLFLVIHLMIAGRLQWDSKRKGLAVFEFDTGSLTLTEAGTKRRASLHLVQGEAALAAMDPGGIDVFSSSLKLFSEKLKSENHTVKRALTDPHLFSGIGNAYSDEILHRAKMSPFAMTSQLSDEDVRRLHEATRETLNLWTDRLRRQTGGGFPEKVTAFRDEMAVHGRFGQPCPVCGAPVQRIVYAENEANYCARCQTEGKVLADRSLSQLLKDDWPRTLEEWEAIRKPRGETG
jgi:formamidopyrimidine-DNA glycosylase